MVFRHQRLAHHQVHTWFCMALLRMQILNGIGHSFRSTKLTHFDQESSKRLRILLLYSRLILRFENKMELVHIWLFSPRMVVALLMVLPITSTVLWGLISSTISLLCVCSLDRVPSNDLSVITWQIRVLGSSLLLCRLLKHKSQQFRMQLNA